MVATGLTRNFRVAWSFRPPEILDIKGFSKSKIEYFSVFSPAFLSKNFLSKKQIEIYTEGYRSGHNGADSKSPSANGSRTSEKPLTVRVSGIRPPQTHREF